MKNNKIQIYPSRQRVELNDKATKALFNLRETSFDGIEDGVNIEIVEKKQHGKKHEEIVSGFTLQTAKGFTYIAPLDEYARAVLGVCVSEYENGAEYITLAALQRGLSGKNCETEGKSHRIYQNQFSELKQAIDKLMATQYDPDILKAFKELEYEGAENVEKAQILPAERLTKIIGGKPVEVLHFLGESPLAKIAKLKGQLLTYDADLLDVPNQNNTRLIITLKNCTLRRVLESIKHSKQLKPILTLDDIFKKLRITNNRKAKEHAREYLDTFFKHLQNKGVIKSFEWIKKGNKFYSIKFTF